jgi:hypothetical protein
MNPPAIVLRWYRQSTGGATTSSEEYTASEVQDLLRPDSDVEPERAEAVRATASQPMRWLDHLSKEERREIGELANRLPMLVFHHAVGRSTSELLARFGGWSTWRYDRALEVACGCIASHLNQSDLAV